MPTKIPTSLYIAMSVAVVLLAPYAGCHLLTKRPNMPTNQDWSEGTTRNPTGGREEQQAQPKGVEEGAGTLNDRDSLADLEQLLNK